MLRLFILFMGICYFMNSASATEVVVVHSNDPNFARGQRLDSQTFLSSPAQGNLTVVFASGGVQTINDAFQGHLIDPLPNHKIDSTFTVDFIDALNKIEDQLVHKAPNRHSRSKTLDNLWLVDVSNKTRDRYYCVAPKRVVLWRPKEQSRTAATLFIKHKVTGKQIEKEWPAYQTTLKWPRGLPIVYGDTYNIELKTRQNGTNFKKLVLYQLPSNLPTNSHKVVWMVGRGCIPQANLLLANLR